MSKRQGTTHQRWVIEPPERPEHWRVDRHIPVALICTLILQTAGAVWWASQLQSRVTELERVNVSTSSQADRLVKLETRFESVLEKLGDIRATLGRFEPRLPPGKK